MTDSQDKYPDPRDAQVYIDVREIDHLLNLPEGLRVRSIRADEFPPRIRVLIEGDSLPPRPVDTEPPGLFTTSVECECGHRRFVWGEDTRDPEPFVDEQGSPVPEWEGDQ